MAKINLTNPDKQELLGAYQNFFGNQRPVILKIVSENLRTLLNKTEWVNTSDFLPDLFLLTDQNDLRRAYGVLNEAGATEKPTETVPTGKLEELKKEQEARQEAQEKARVASEQEVKNFINQNQQRIAQAKKIQAALKDKVIYAKIETPIPPKLTEQEAEFVETITEAAKANPQQLTLDLTNEIKARIIKNAPGIPSQEAEILAKEAVFTAVQKLVDPTSFDEALILSQVAANPNLIAAQTKQAEIVAEQAALVAASETETFQDAHEVIASVFGKNLAFRLIGPETLSEVKVFLSSQPIEGGKPFALEQIPQQYGQTLDNQNNFITDLKGFGQEEIKSHLFSKANLWLDNKIAKLPVDSTLAKLYNSPKIRTALSFVGLGRPIEWVGTTFFGKIAVGTGFGPVVGWLGNVTGLKVGVAEATAKLAPAAGKAITKVGAGLLAKTGLSATFAQIGAALGSWAPIVGNIIGAALGWLAGKLIDPLLGWLQKHKEDVTIAGILALGGGIIFGSLPLIVLGGLIAVPGILGGIGISGIGRGLGTFFAGLGSAFVVTIGTPIIIALVVFPVLVALILFIINSGAYLVPPGSTMFGGIPPGGNLTKCDPNATGAEITDQLAGSIQAGSVYFLPNSLGSRKEGLCMVPTMIVLHTSGGYDNDQGNSATYQTLVTRNVSCQLATDTNDTILMLSFFEKQVEVSWCANDLNVGGISIEMAGECQGGCAPVAKCSPNTSLTYSPTGPHPCPDLENLAFDAICKIMRKYSIPWSQVFQHEASNGTHTDPIGDEWVNKFILRLKNNCQI